MPSVSEEEKILFLISCVRNTGDGKPNWKAVCEERGILTINAATKRWNRLSNANPVGAAAKSSAQGAAGGALAKTPGGRLPWRIKRPKGRKRPRRRRLGLPRERGERLPKRWRQKWRNPTLPARVHWRMKMKQ